MLVASLASASPPKAAQAPAPGALKAIPVKKGDLVPVDGVFLPKAKAISIATKCQQAEHRSVQLPPTQYLLGSAVVGLVLGVLVGGFIVAIVKK